MADLILTWIDGKGRETDDVTGYFAADYFATGDLEEAKALAEDGETDAADNLLKSSYKGADCEGIGLRWFFV